MMNAKETSFDATIPVLATIRAKLPSISEAQQRIGRFVLQDPKRAYKMSISDLARETQTKSESGIVRFYRTLGFSGFHDFKVTLATEIAGKSFYHTYEDITDDDSASEVTDKIFRGAIRTLDDNTELLDHQAIERSVELLASARRVYLLGYGSSAALAYDAYFKFSALGIDCHWSPDSHMNAVLLSEPAESDVVFAISQSGESRDLVTLAERARPVATVIALTGDRNSHLGQIADVCIATSSEEMNYRSDAIISRIVQSAVIGALFAALSVKLGKPAQDRLVSYRRAVSHLK